MASPIGYLIHPDPPPAHGPAPRVVPAVARPTSGPHHNPPVPVNNSGFPNSGPVPAPAHPPTSRPDPESGSTSDPNTHNQAQPLYQCADCLRRHIASHTLGKRFTCDVCSKGFSRADLLKRHRTNHLEDNGKKRRRLNGDPSVGRVGQACTACARARVKCEDSKPQVPEATRFPAGSTRGLSCEVVPSEDAALSSAHHTPASYVRHHKSTPEFSTAVSNTPGHLHHRLPVSSSSSYAPSAPSASPEDYKEGAMTPASNNPQLQPLNASASTPLSQSQTVPATYDSYPSNNAVVGYAAQEGVTAEFPDFLRGVLYAPNQPVPNASRVPDTQDPFALDFYDDTTLDFNEFNFNLLNHWNVGPAQSTAAAEPTTAPDNNRDPAGVADVSQIKANLIKIWDESPWRWIPQNTDNRYTDQSHLPLPTNVVQDKDTPSRGAPTGAPTINRVSKETLRPSCRDRILAIVLSTCREARMANRVASSFPSAETMDSWINLFLAAHMRQPSSWIHYGSFSLNAQWPEFLVSAVAAGAVLTPVPAFRRFAFALQEAIPANFAQFEENNEFISEINKVQALVLLQDVGLWCGNKRKMEITECRKGRFNNSSYPDPVIHPFDEGKVLEEKWKEWHQHESWKRLIFHVYIRDAQASMTQLNPPFMSYAELILPLPAPRELWFASTAEEFKARYLASSGGYKRPPSLVDILRDVNVLAEHQSHVDWAFATSIYLHAVWSLVWEYRQLLSVHVTPKLSQTPTTTALLLDSRRIELIAQLRAFRQLTLHHLRPHDSPPSPYEGLLIHNLLFQLHTPLADIQLFVGKEDEHQARRVYPSLQRWAASRDARQGMWHAAQVLRCAKAFPRGRLREFCVLATGHLMLAVWAWGVLTMMRVAASPSEKHRGGGEHYDKGAIVFLDRGSDGVDDGTTTAGDETPDVRRWIDSDQGRPALTWSGTAQRDDSTTASSSSGSNSNDAKRSHVATSNPTDGEPCFLEDPKACIQLAQEVIRANFVGVWETSPPMNENIVASLAQMEKAVGKMGG
ncbi:zinc finger protein klf1 [Dichotomopilus funicola]|uniref:Zinc finger protein klf1 n=1 Tax=Dichotomopilus funicola TaxID=1934379 RepID=A0AAN6VA47_9PEZI|nr:zinc finger protein klf1 [Dichotomopilus funicola]